MRQKMPNRRRNTTTTIDHQSHRLYSTIGYDPETDLPREAFFTMRTKSGTLMDGLLYDAGVLLSLALQYGTPSTALATSVARLDDVTAASPIGELVDEIVKETKAIQSRSAGVEDAEVSRTVR